MIGLNGKVRTESESKGYYRDVLQSQINNTFNLSEDRLLFITYQPTEKTYLASTVTDFTKELFKDYPYIEVIERTYQYSAKKNGCSFDDTYHSHILIRLNDYKSLEAKLGYKLGLRLDIVDRIVWDLDGLVDRYLIKQKGVTSLDMDLPIRHLPDNKKVHFTINETVNEPFIIQSAVQAADIIELILSINKVFRSVSINNIVSECFENINKIYWMHMFIDDT